ncbi:hypothetical protein Ancab_010625 [Ancistrocladus abbreviatus]
MVDEDEFSIYVADEAPFPEERSRAKWYGSEESFDESFEVAIPSTASTSVEPTRNGEMVSKQFEFHRLSRENVCRIDDGEKLIVFGAEVDNQRYDVVTHLASNANPPPKWPISTNSLGSSLEAHFQFDNRRVDNGGPNTMTRPLDNSGDPKIIDIRPNDPTRLAFTNAST